jgi:hypothetical protein
MCPGGLSARSNDCTGTSCSSTTAPSSRQWHSPRSRPTQPVMLLPTREHTSSLAQDPRTTATASSSFRNSTSFIWHSSGVRCPPHVFQFPGSQDQQSQHLSKSVIPTQLSVTEQLTKNWTPFVSAMQARASRNLDTFTSIRSTRPQSRTLPCVWR